MGAFLILHFCTYKWKSLNFCELLKWISKLLITYIATYFIAPCIKVEMVVTNKLTISQSMLTPRFLKRHIAINKHTQIIIIIIIPMPYAIFKERALGSHSHSLGLAVSCPNHTNFLSTSGCKIVGDVTRVGCQVVHTNISVCSTFWRPVATGQTSWCRLFGDNYSSSYNEPTLTFKIITCVSQVLHHTEDSLHVFNSPFVLGTKLLKV